MKINRNIDKFFVVFNEVKENVDEDLTLRQLIDATNSLIRLTKEEYIDKSFLKNYDNDNRKPLDKIFTCDEKFLPIDIGCENKNKCDYPLIAEKVCNKITNNDIGILICGSGIGMSIKSNRFNVKLISKFPFPAAVPLSYAPEAKTFSYNMILRITMLIIFRLQYILIF